MLLAFPPPPLPLPSPLPASQSCFQHPPPQRLRIHFLPVFRPQMLRRQRRPNRSPTSPPYLSPTSPSPQLRNPSPYARFDLRPAFRCFALLPLLPGTAAQPLRFRNSPSSAPLRPPAATARSSPEPAPPLDSTPPCSSPLPPIYPPSGSLIRGHFYRGQKGTLSSRYNSTTTNRHSKLIGFDLY